VKIKVNPPVPKPAPEAQYNLTLSEAEFQIFLAYLKGTAGETHLEPRLTVDAMLRSVYRKVPDAKLSKNKWIRERPILLVKKGKGIYGG